METETRVSVTVDWDQAPAGAAQASLRIYGTDATPVTVQAVVDQPTSLNPEQFQGFVESNGYVSIEAEHFTEAVNTESSWWQRIPDLGRTLSGMTPWPVLAPSQSPGGDSPRLQYRMFLLRSGNVRVRAHISPSQDYFNNGGLRYAVSFDDQPPQTVNIHGDSSRSAWERWVTGNINVTISNHTLSEPGEHVLNFWMVDPGVVLEKLVVDTAGVAPSYLGPPESYRLGG